MNPTTKPLPWTIPKIVTKDNPPTTNNPHMLVATLFLIPIDLKTTYLPEPIHHTFLLINFTKPSELSRSCMESFSPGPIDHLSSTQEGSGRYDERNNLTKQASIINHFSFEGLIIKRINHSGGSSSLLHWVPISSCSRPLFPDLDLPDFQSKSRVALPNGDD